MDFARSKMMLEARREAVIKSLWPTPTYPLPETFEGTHLQYQPGALQMMEVPYGQTVKQVLENPNSTATPTSEN